MWKLIFRWNAMNKRNCQFIYMKSKTFLNWWLAEHGWSTQQSWSACSSWTWPCGGMCYTGMLLVIFWLLSYFLYLKFKMYEVWSLGISYRHFSDLSHHLYRILGKLSFLAKSLCGFSMLAISFFFFLTILNKLGRLTILARGQLAGRICLLGMLSQQRK